LAAPWRWARLRAGLIWQRTLRPVPIRTRALAQRVHRVAAWTRRAAGRWRVRCGRRGHPAAGVADPWSARNARRLNDSKQLTAARREQFFAVLTASQRSGGASAGWTRTWWTRSTSSRANASGHERCAGPVAASSRARPGGWTPRPRSSPSQTAIVHGDAHSYSIAAASVLAKVTRDRLMTDYDRQWPAYGFAVPQGYGTERHLAALAVHGPCRFTDGHSPRCGRRNRVVGLHRVIRPRSP